MKMVSEIMEPVNGWSLQEKERPYVLKKEHVFCAGIYPYVQEIARLEMVCVHANDPADKAIEAILSAKVSALPVVENGEVVGIVRAGDLLALFDEPYEHSEVEYRA
ncbi:MAG: CBS domain-containing protein [Bacillota bacterium]